MELSEAIEKRRSIRKYKKEVPSDDLIRKCVEAACFAPSAHNSQPWKFVVVKDKEKILALSKTQPWSAFLAGAPVVIVALAEESKSPRHWIEDLSCAIMLLMLKAAELGLGTCWNAVYSPEDQKREDYVRKILGIPSKYRVLANIGLGFPDEKPAKKKVKSFEEAVLEIKD
ncbi:MAG: nitroreductase family protein [Candidatus Aenigmatarchaeota archaeon]